MKKVIRRFQKTQKYEPSEKKSQISVQSVKVRQPSPPSAVATETITSCSNTMSNYVNSSNEYAHMVGQCLCFKCSCGRHKCQFSHLKCFKNHINMNNYSVYRQNFDLKPKIQIQIPIRENWHHHSKEKHIIEMKTSAHDYKQNPNFYIQEVQRAKSPNFSISQNIVSSYNSSYPTRFKQSPPSPNLKKKEQKYAYMSQEPMQSSYRANFQGVQQLQINRPTVPKSARAGYWVGKSLYKNTFKGDQGVKPKKFDLGMLDNQFKMEGNYVGKTENQRQFQNTNTQCEAFK